MAFTAWLVAFVVVALTVAGNEPPPVFSVTLDDEGASPANLRHAVRHDPRLNQRLKMWQLSGSEYGVVPTAPATPWLSEIHDRLGLPALSSSTSIVTVCQIGGRVRPELFQSIRNRLRFIYVHWSAAHLLHAHEVLSALDDGEVCFARDGAIPGLVRLLPATRRDAPHLPVLLYAVMRACGSCANRPLSTPEFALPLGFDGRCNMRARAVDDPPGVARWESTPRIVGRHNVAHT